MNEKKNVGSDFDLSSAFSPMMAMARSLGLQE